jgi:hypothetical protein
MYDNVFNAHIENLKRELKVDPLVVFGNEAINASKRYGRLAQGAYLWENGENIIAMPNKDMIGTLAHEMRHAWQMKHKDYRRYFTQPKNNSFLMKKIRRFNYLLHYSFRKEERDANKFALNYCKRMGLLKDERRIKLNISILNLAAFLVILGYLLILSPLRFLF